MAGFQFNWGAPPAFAGPDMMGLQTPSMFGAAPITSGGFAPVGDGQIALPNLGGVQPMGGTGGLNASMFGGGLGANMDTAKLALSGIGTLGSLWGAFQAANLAKKQFNYTRDVTETNMANQLKTFNTGLTDRANNRAIVEGRSPAETAAYIDANKLTRYGR